MATTTIVKCQCCRSVIGSEPHLTDCPQAPRYQHVAFRESFGVATWRYDLDAPGGIIDNIRTLDVRDTSPEHSIANDGYNSACGYCYLGAGHTVKYHAAAILRGSL